LNKGRGLEWDYVCGMKGCLGDIVLNTPLALFHLPYNFELISFIKISNKKYFSSNDSIEDAFLQLQINKCNIVH
jgi:hypothetical protein